MYFNTFGLPIHDISVYSREDIEKYLVFADGKSIYDIQQEIKAKNEKIGWIVQLDLIFEAIEIEIENLKQVKDFKQIITKVDKVVKITKPQVIQLKLDLL